MARLTAWVHVPDPDNGGVRAFGPNDDVPDWAAEWITNPHAWTDAPPSEAATAAEAEPASEEPPRSGRGSGADAWAAYAGSLGISVDPDWSRDDIIERVDAHRSGTGG